MLAPTHPAVYETAMIDAAQMRMARGALDWRQEDLAEKSGVSLASIKNIEKGKTDPRVSTMKAIQDAFEAAGIQFVDDGDTRSGGRGARFRA